MKLQIAKVFDLGGVRVIKWFTSVRLTLQVKALPQSVNTEWKARTPGESSVSSEWRFYTQKKVVLQSRTESSIRFVGHGVTRMHVQSSNP